MSARVCSPPVMDLSREILMTPSCSTSSSSQQPHMSMSSSSYPGAPGQRSTQFLQGVLSSSTTTSQSMDSVNRLCRSVSRNLFGTPSGTSHYARQKVQEMREADSKRWNFDFDNEVPLDGRYKWEAVGTIRPTRQWNEGAGTSSTASEIPKASACSGMPVLSSTSTTTSVFSSYSTSTAAVNRGNVGSPDSLLLVRPVDVSNLVGSQTDSTTERSHQDPVVSISEIPNVSPSSIESLTSDPVPEEPHSPVLVESSVESSEDDAIVPISSLLKTDSSSIRVRVKSKQTKMTEFMPVKKRRGGPARTTAGKKATL